MQSHRAKFTAVGHGPYLYRIESTARGASTALGVQSPAQSQPTRPTFDHARASKTLFPVFHSFNPWGEGRVYGRACVPTETRSTFCSNGLAVGRGFERHTVRTVLICSRWCFIRHGDWVCHGSVKVKLGIGPTHTVWVHRPKRIAFERRHMFDADLQTNATVTRGNQSVADKRILKDYAKRWCACQRRSVKRSDFRGLEHRPEPGISRQWIRVKGTQRRTDLEPGTGGDIHPVYFSTVHFWDVRNTQVEGKARRGDRRSSMSVMAVVARVAGTITRQRGNAQ
jgi:hypothetical protein